MKRLWLIVSGLAFATGAIAHYTGQGVATVVILGFIGGVFLILGLAGDKP